MDVRDATGVGVVRRSEAMTRAINASNGRVSLIHFFPRC